MAKVIRQGRCLVVGRGLRLYPTPQARNRAKGQLRRYGANYFVYFRDVDKQFPHGLNFGIAEWVAPGGEYFKR